jgi:hypothetical protein
MFVRPPPERPLIFAVTLVDRKVVDAGDAAAHQAVLIELPILVAVGPEPVTTVVVPFVGDAHREAVLAEGPQLLDRAIVQLAVPFCASERP